MPDYVQKWDHDPDAHLDYTWDWSLWLDKSPQDTVVSATFASNPEGADVSPALISNDGKRVTAFVRTTVSAAITCHITTSGGREDDRTIYLNVVER